MSLDTPSAASAVGDLAAALGKLRVHDVSPVIRPEMSMWFMYRPPEINSLFEHAEAGAAANSLTIAEHTGTHVDAPFHFDPAGATIDELPVDRLLLRPFKKYDLKANDHQPGELVDVPHLKAAEEQAGITLEGGDVALLELGWDRYLPGGDREREPTWWGSNQPGLSDEACAYLADREIAAVACDTAACDVAAVDGEFTVAHGHTKYFLPRGIPIVEGLCGLAAVPATGLFLTLPLKIEGGTASPVRVLLLSE